MNQNQLFTDLNTSFNKQQNPLRNFELPCNREYERMNIGACSYFLLSEYPADVEVFISLNPEFKDAFKVDNRNTGFKISDVYSQQGVPSFVKDVYIWTKGITNLTDSDGKPKKVKIITSSIPSFEILNNSSINSIESIGQIGSINGLVGYPQGAITLCGLLVPTFTRWVGSAQLEKVGEYKTSVSEILDMGSILDPYRNYIVSAKGIIDPEVVLPLSTASHSGITEICSAHMHAGIVLPPESPLPHAPNNLFPLMAKSYVIGFRPSQAGGNLQNCGGGTISDEGSFQYTGKYILENFCNAEGKLEFKLDMTCYMYAEGATAGAQRTNTKASYQISAYRTGV